MRDVDGRKENNDNPPPEGSGEPKFGRLLIVLAFALLVIVAITFGSEAYFS